MSKHRARLVARAKELGLSILPYTRLGRAECVACGRIYPTLTVFANHDLVELANHHCRPVRRTAGGARR